MFGGTIGFIVVCIFIGIRARQMGYSGILWFAVSFLVFPLVGLCLLAALPNRTIETKRRIEMELLQSQLTRRRNLRVKAPPPIPTQTISDDRTIR